MKDLKIFTANLDQESIAVETISKELEKAKRKIEIKDNYMNFLVDVLYDYDGYYNKETKKGDIGELAKLIDETVSTLGDAITCNDKRIMYQNKYHKFNILREEILNKGK